MLSDAFFLVLCRSAGFFIFSPFFSRFNLSVLIKLSLSIFFAFLLFPFLPQEKIAIADFFLGFFYGYIAGWIFAALFESLLLAGQLVGVLIGVSATELLNPSSSPALPLMSQFYWLAAIAFFFSTSLYQQFFIFISNVLSSPFHIATSATLFEQILATTTLFLKLTFAFSAPVLLVSGGLILMLAIFAKMMPEWQVYWMGLPAQILVGIVATLYAITPLPSLVRVLLEKGEAISQKILFSFTNFPW